MTATPSTWWAPAASCSTTAVAAELFERDEYRSAAAHGMAFLQSAHRQPDGGYAWVLGAGGVEDGDRHCYGHAFVLLAAAMATRAGVPGAAAVTGAVYELLEERFWEPGARLYADEITAGDWGAVSPYRGQNANMHMCEAMLAAFEATGEERYLERADTLARRICVELAGAGPGPGVGALHHRLEARLGVQPRRSEKPVPPLRLPAPGTSWNGPSCC